jgi:hypothetical protein
VELRAVSRKISKGMRDVLESLGSSYFKKLGLKQRMKTIPAES